MRKFVCAALAAAVFAGGALTAAAPAAAQPGRDRYYYNGQWIDQGQFYRHRDDWRRGRRDNNDALAAGIIGFALGAAIVGSQTDTQYSYDRRDDRRHRNACQRAYRSYDYRSNTYLGPDGYRHYCIR